MEETEKNVKWKAKTHKSNASQKWIHRIHAGWLPISHFLDCSPLIDSLVTHTLLLCCTVALLHCFTVHHVLSTHRLSLSRHRPSAANMFHVPSSSSLPVDAENVCQSSLFQNQTDKQG